MSADKIKTRKIPAQLRPCYLSVLWATVHIRASRREDCIVECRLGLRGNVLILRRYERRLLQLGLEREFDGGGIAVELLEVVEFPLRGKKYMHDDITCNKSAEDG